MRRRKYIEKAVEQALQSHGEMMSYLGSAQSDLESYEQIHSLVFSVCKNKNEATLHDLI